LDFPDEIQYGKCPVKYTTTKTILVRNMGALASKFNLAIQPPFYVSPDNGFLYPNESLQVDVSFTPESQGRFESNLMVQYDTGEMTSSLVTGLSESLDVKLSRPKIKFPNTYITRVATEKISLINESTAAVNSCIMSYQ
jgi:hydrocephalus-inducing protein